MRTTPLALLLLAAACGGDGVTPDGPPTPDAPPTAERFAGFWLMTSIEVTTPTGSMTLERDGDPGVRGDVVFTATGAESGTLDVRQVLLDAGLVASEIMAMGAEVALEGDTWLLTEQGGGVIVFDSALAGDHLVLTVDADDPRTTATDPPQRIELDRVPPWTTTVVGGWQLVSITLPSGTIPANTCLELAPGTWGTVQMNILFSTRHLFMREMIQTRYSDEQCTALVDTTTSTQDGYAEEENDATLRIWGIEAGVAEYQAFTMVLAGEEATLTRTACLPQPACEDSAPLTVVVRRAMTR
jgi:hypothetical protein